MKLDPKMRTLKAIRPHKYGTRHLTAGEEYEASPRHAVALVAAKRARFADKPQRTKQAAPVTTVHVSEATPAGAITTPESRAVGAMSTADDPRNLDQLRLQATQLGINVDGRWGAARLQYEIAQATRG